MRVIHCPEIIGGHASALAAAERALGLDSRCISLGPHPFAYPADQILSGGSRFGIEIARWKLLSILMRDADVVHFNFGMSAMPQRVAIDAPWDAKSPRWARSIYNLYAAALELRDLEWLKRMGKKIVVTFQGDDARQGDVLRRSYETHAADEVPIYTRESDELKRRRIGLFERHADTLFALNPDLLRGLPRRARFLPYAVQNAAAETRPPMSSSPTEPVVLHAPSHRGAKGTRFVLSAVDRLRTEGVRFRFVLVEGVAHAKALELYATADLVIDQLLYGWYGALAVEVMALGKPVIAYVRESDLPFLPSQMRSALPVINADPLSIYDVLKKAITASPAVRQEQGRRSLEYARQWHDPRAVAAITRGAYVAALESEQASH